MGADLRTLPRSAESIGDEFFGVIWADGHESIYPARYLRAHCPCASCNEKRLRASKGPDTGGGISLPVVGAEEPAAPLSIVRHEPMGRYAVRFVWSDRHDTGIFPFDLLRALCPCDACDAARAAKTPPPPRGIAPRR